MLSAREKEGDKPRYDGSEEGGGSGAAFIILIQRAGTKRVSRGEFIELRQLAVQAGRHHHRARYRPGHSKALFSFIRRTSAIREADPRGLHTHLPRLDRQWACDEARNVEKEREEV